MKRRVPLIHSISFLWLLTGCIETYYPPPGAGQGGQLVIDGFIDATHKSATVKLSRSIALGEAVQMPRESKASVIIKSSSGAEYTLLEDGDIDHTGTYAAADLVLNPADKYQLHVVTESGEAYSSDEILLHDSPSLDSISWLPETTGVRFYVSAHDPDNKTRYYRWTFVETFQYNTQYVSYFKKVDGQPVPRNGDEYVYFCWSSSNSSNIMTTSTTKLTNDVVSMFPIYFVPKGSRKMSLEYSLRVQQRAVSQQEFEFWEMMKKTTETVGGLFDPIPAQVLGNVHADNNSNEKVLGFFSGGYVDEITKYVNHLEIPGYLRIVDPFDFACAGRPLYLNQLDEISPNEVYLNTFGSPFIEGYIVIDKLCADCRSLYNGTNVRPKDWPIL
jgi:hypothetical protein